ncbi:hypothetical protein ACFVZW_09240 [Streptomyces sp. NPDC059567]|uniref:hypothetical protein n=1 Tax=Streptomyces sp. NPDC059567 TaxID=3346867 RepID=UPI0036AC2835
MSVLPAHVTRDPLRLVLVLIGGVTVLTGACQLFAPGFVLDRLSADSTGISRHLFATVGMFMVVVGGLLVQGLLTPAPPPYLLFWAGLQKFGAFVLVGIGVLRDLFAALALLVAFFDLATALLCWLMARRLASRAGDLHTAGAAR